MIHNHRSVISSIYGIDSGSFGYTPDDELSSETYDANGNVLSTGGKSFTYDSENHLMSMSATGTSATIVYDGDGNRVAKTVTANGVPTTTLYLVDDLNPTGYAQVVEELQGGAVTRQYTYGLQRIDENQRIDNVWTPSFYGYDGGGNVRQLTSVTGAVTDSYEYDAFGNSFTVSGTTPNNYLYRGEQYDSDLGLYYLRARYYNPLTGRFMSRDPEQGNQYDPVSLHKYLYANGDPMNIIDRSGRAGELVQFALIYEVVTQVTIPSVVAYVGESVTLAAIPWIASTLNAAASAAAVAAAVAVFVDDALATKEAQGVMKLFTCITLGVYYADLVDVIAGSNADEEKKKWAETYAHGEYVAACEWALH